jgi:hypothetical protein
MEATAASATAAAMGQGQQARTSAYRGVGWCKRTGKWYASLWDKGHSQHLGYFATEGEAAQAYDARARQLRGVVAQLNFPGEGERQGTAQQRVDPQAKAANVAAVATQQQCTSAYPPPNTAAWPAWPVGPAGPAAWPAAWPARPSPSDVSQHCGAPRWVPPPGAQQHLALHHHRPGSLQGAAACAARCQPCTR